MAKDVVNVHESLNTISLLGNVIVSGGAEVVAGGQGQLFQRDGQQGVAVREVSGDEVPGVQGVVRQAVDTVASRTRSRRPMREGGRVGGRT